MVVLAAGEVGAVSAFAEMLPQGGALRARQQAVELARDGARGLMARERALERLTQGTAGAEDERFDFVDRVLEDLGDLLVRTALYLAHDESGALVEVEPPESATDVVWRRPLLVADRGNGGVVELDLLEAAGRLPKAAPADLVAIPINQLRGALGRSPPLKARYAFRNVVCVTSSASCGVGSTTSA